MLVFQNRYEISEHNDISCTIRTSAMFFPQLLEELKAKFSSQLKDVEHTRKIMHTGLKQGGDCITCIHWLKSQLSRMFCLNIFFTSLIIWPHNLCNTLTPSQPPCLTHSPDAAVYKGLAQQDYEALTCTPRGQKAELPACPAGPPSSA